MKKIGWGILLMTLMAGCGQPETPPPQKTTAQAPQTSEVMVARGVSLLKEAKIELAIQAFDEAIRQDPLNITPYMLLGETYMRLGAQAQAIDTFSAALRVAPEQGEIYYLLAVNYGIIGQLEAAKQSAEQAIAIFHRNQDEENFKKTLILLQGLSGAEANAEEGAAEEMAAPVPVEEPAAAPEAKDATPEAKPVDEPAME